MSSTASATSGLACCGPWLPGERIQGGNSIRRQSIDLFPDESMETFQDLGVVRGCRGLWGEDKQLVSCMCSFRPLVTLTALRQIRWFNHFLRSASVDNGQKGVTGNLGPKRGVVSSLPSICLRICFTFPSGFKGNISLLDLLLFVCYFSRGLKQMKLQMEKSKRCFKHS